MLFPTEMYAKLSVCTSMGRESTVSIPPSPGHRPPVEPLRIRGLDHLCHLRHIPQHSSWLLSPPTPFQKRFLFHFRTFTLSYISKTEHIICFLDSTLFHFIATTLIDDFASYCTGRALHHERTCTGSHSTYRFNGTNPAPYLIVINKSCLCSAEGSPPVY